MVSSNIGYHTRLSGNNTVKVSGGSFGGNIDMETIERLVNAMFTVTIKPSGRAVFVDRQGKEVSLYISVDPEKTTKGKAAKTEYQKVLAQKQAIEEQKKQEIEELMYSMSNDEILKRLKETR